MLSRVWSQTPSCTGVPNASEHTSSGCCWLFAMADTVQVPGQRKVRKRRPLCRHNQCRRIKQKKHRRLFSHYCRFKICNQRDNALHCFEFVHESDSDEYCSYEEEDSEGARDDFEVPSVCVFVCV